MLHGHGKLQPGCYGVQAADEDCMREVYGFAQGHSGKHKDDLIWQVLKDSFLFAARKKEADFFRSKGAWLKVPR